MNYFNILVLRVSSGNDSSEVKMLKLWPFTRVDNLSENVTGKAH